ncbi:putative integron gene cassette protein [Streptomyces hygroscopicus subsp. jinggangensis 5008]|nr:putative integron gene cassette protein [Streptomyces hygroscopicus subsp. jinggangensis 5008]
MVHLDDVNKQRVHSTVTMNGKLIRMTGDFRDVTRSNKDILLTAMRELFAEKDLTALNRYWADPYVQHSPNLPNGTDGLRAAVPALEGFSWNPERIFEDGDYVITHSRTSGWSPDGETVIVDIFRFENGRIAEHWDVIQPYVPTSETASGNPMV